MGLLDQGIDVSSIEVGGTDNTPFPEGEYTLSAALYEELLSKNGNEMINGMISLQVGRFHRDEWR